MKTIQERIHHIQKLLHLDDEQMAEKLGLEEEAYQRGIEVSPSELLELLCTTFGVSLSYLEEGKGSVFRERSLPVSDILAFRDARNWKQFHTPKDLAISLSLESSELLECFQWSGEDVHVGKKQKQMEEELADILIYSVLFADSIGVDIPTIIEKKLRKNAEKYDVKKAYGSAKKYTEL
nr:nucleotide pyrophosphohydrolase [uncultured Sphaerochaeta sp.]